MEISKSALTRLSRRAGVKSVSEDSYDLIRLLIAKQTDEVIRTCIIVNSERGTKTLLPTDLYESVSFLGEHLTKSTEIGKGKMKPHVFS